jgi:hypothetical protein
MKTFNLLLVLVLALGAFAFMPQAETFAGGTVPPVPAGCTSTDCESGYDMADCSTGDCKLMNGYNFVNVPAGPYKVSAQTLTSAPGGPAGLTLQPKPVNVYFSPAETLAFVEVCFPKGSGTGQVFKHSNAGWLPLPTTFVNGLACGTAWGGGTFGYFK